MDQQVKESTLEQIKSYGEWIELGKQNAESDRDFAVQCYEKALELTEDKYEPLILIAQAHRIFGSTQFVLETLPLALNLANDKIDRLIAIACEYKHITYDWHAQEIHGWIKELDPTYDHEVPKTYEDYQEIFKEYIIECRAINRIHCATRSIEKIIELSPNKMDDLIEIGSQILLQDNLELAQKYFNRALEIQEDKYDALMKIGDAYQKSKLYELSLKYYLDASLLRPETFQPHLRVVKSKLELQQQEALDYCINIKIPKEKQVYIDLGLILADYDQSFELGQQYILKGVELSQNKYETLQQLIKQCYGTKINKVLLQQAIEIDGNDLELATTYGIEQSQFKKADHMKNWDGTEEEKMNAFKRVILLNPQSDEYYYYLTQAYIKLDKIQDEIDFLKTINNAGKDLYLELGSLLLKNNQLDEAIKFLNLVIQLDISANCQYKIVSMLYDQKHYVECINKCNELQILDQQCSSTYFYKAQSLHQLGKQEEAYPIFKKAQEINYSRDVEDLIEILYGTENQEQIKQSEL